MCNKKRRNNRDRNRDRRTKNNKKIIIKLLTIQKIEMTDSWLEQKLLKDLMASLTKDISANTTKDSM